MLKQEDFTMRKKFISALLLGVVLFGLTGCTESNDERLAREVREAEKRYQDAVGNYNDLIDDFNDYLYWSDRVQ